MPQEIQLPIMVPDWVGVERQNVRRLIASCGTIVYFHTRSGLAHRADKRCVTRMLSLSVRKDKAVHTYNKDTVCPFLWDGPNAPHKRTGTSSHRRR